MTVCNMTIEGGGRAGMIAPDETTFEWVEGRPGAPADFERARSSAGARCPPTTARAFDAEVEIDASAISPMVTWGTNPGMVTEVTGAVPDPADWGEGPADRETAERALAYMALEPGTPIGEIALDRVFIGSCTNSRIGDLREAAADGRRAAGSPTPCGRWSVPGSQQVRGAGRGGGPRRGLPQRRVRMARRRLLDVPGDEPGHPRSPGERCASTSNRNFEGRQGRGGRTHLVCPQMAAAAAIEGRFVDIREWDGA